MVASLAAFPARPSPRPHAGPAPSRRYERRRPEKTPLHKVVSEYLESWLAWREAAERPVSGYVEDELRGYLACGILCFGFARAVCMTCRTGFVVAFSCKGRGFCPSCGTRRMVDTAAWLTDHVIPQVPVRQWVLSLPFAFRYLLATRPEVVTQVLGIVYRAISAHLIHKAGLTRASAVTGAVTLIQRFGSALNLNVHFAVHGRTNAASAWMRRSGPPARARRRLSA